MNALERRIVRLERKNRLMTATLAVTASLALIPWLAGGKAQNDIITAREFRVVDGDGDTFGRWMEQNGVCEFIMRSKESMDQGYLYFSTRKTGPGMRIVGPGDAKAKVGVAPTILLTANDKEANLALAAGGEPQVMLDADKTGGSVSRQEEGMFRHLK